jgi:MtrB/PioB family decaheme-associated outer membrane protein
MPELPWKYTWEQPEPILCAIGGERMKVKIIIVAMMICLIPLFSAFSEEKVIEGEITGVGKYVGVDGGEGGRAKFTEYRDLREPGVFYLRGRLNYDTPDYFLRFDMQDPGYDTQHYKLEGGMWGNFKFDLFYNEIPHNITFDARTFFLGAGHDTLVGAPNPNFTTWNTFDYSIERRQYGGGLKLNMMKPFFFDASFQREEREGIKPTGAAGTSPGGIGIELPEPVSYLTNNLKLQAGYAKKPLFLSLTYLYSDFNNSNTALNFINPATAAQDVFSLPPDNTYQKGAFKGAVSLPFNSRFSTNMGFSRGESETSLFPTFNGKVDTQNYDFVLTSNPVRFFDAKVFYKYYKRDNRSDAPLGTVEGFLDYKISKYGADLGFRLPAKFYLTGGYQYVVTKRDFRADPNDVLPFNRDNIYSVDLKWSGLDFLDVRVGYEKFDRDAHYRTFETAVQPDRKYSYAAQNRDTVKAAIDIFPLENLDIGFEYRYRKIDYSDTVFGLKKDKRDEFGSNVAYTLGKMAKLYGNVDFGLIKFQPDLVRSGLQWDVKQKDRTFGYGFGTEIYAIPNKLTFVFQHDYVKSNGSADFTIDPGLFVAANGLAGANQDTVDIMRAEDYTLYSFKIKAIYNFTKSLAASLGYAYQRFSYKDAQLDGYQFVPGGGVGSNGAYLTGAYKDQSYKAHLIFGGMSYKF